MCMARSSKNANSPEFNKKRHEIIESYYKLQRKTPKVPVTLEALEKETGVDRAAVRKYFYHLAGLRSAVKERYPNSIQYDVATKSTTATKNDLVDWYIEMYQKGNCTPTKNDIQEDGRYTVHMVNNHYGSIRNLEKVCRDRYPDKFNDVSIASVMTLHRVQELRKSLGKYKKFVVTTAVTGCEVHKPFYASLKQFCEINNAKLLILVCSDPAKPKDRDTGFQKIHKSLLDETILIEKSALNSNLWISNVKLSAKHMRPTAGYKNRAKKLGSCIFASPKISLEYASVRNNKDKLPHFVATTGAITVPDYNTEMYMALRTAEIAEFDHKMGAAYVEIVDNEKFHYTQIECKSDNGEIFLRDASYRPNREPVKVRAEAFIMGDLHAGATDPRVAKCWEEVIKLTRPRYIAIHDGFNGASVNGHIDNDFIAKALRAMEGRDSVEDEIKVFAESLKHWASMCEKLLIIPSNHNDWLERWLRKAKFTAGDKNSYVGICLAKAAMEKKNPLRYAVEEIAGIKIPNIVWLGRNEDFLIEGIQVNCHGDVAANGVKGSLAGMVNSYIESFSGHTHTAGILFDAWQVGTSCYLQEEYNNGASTWTNTSGLIYKGGSRCLINVIDGEWRLSK